MNNRTFANRAATAMVVLAVLSGCQLVKKLTGRGNDAGSTQSAPILADAGGPSPVIALPNPTVSPLPTQNPTPAPDVNAPAIAAPDAAAPSTPDAPADPSPGIAVVDAGGVPTNEPRGRHNYFNYCKEHPGRVHPVTHVLCPM